jgi:hypothetical protein
MRRLPEAVWWDFDLANLPIDNYKLLFQMLAHQGMEHFPGYESDWVNIDDDRSFFK